MTALTALTILAMNNQTMIEIVGIFLALQCHGRGASTRVAQINDAIGSSKCMTDKRGGKKSMNEQKRTEMLLKVRIAAECR
jgi:hypothetical protein